ncbi:phage tail sheath C-terminal domain-containing protein [Glutamicibacter protophormiae]|uniref:phage tail sheath C-terminal domain-containing protein n=1 Tax=Glutamicibacter protophormiae TaxID=37930 RepID=UPI003A91A152
MPTTPLTPGIYRLPLAPTRAPGRLARSDVPALLGYAARGPVNAPVRVFSLEQFEQIFGSRVGHLWDAVKGFFENGGATAYIIRVATGESRAASALLREAVPGAGDVRWRAEASFPWNLIDPRRLSGPDPADGAGWIQVFEEQLRRSGTRSPDPGSWGSTLVLRVQRASLARTSTVADNLDRGDTWRLESLVGIQQHSVLELSQVLESGTSLHARLLPLRVEPDRSLVTWAHAPAGFDPTRPVRVESVEFAIQVSRDGQSTGSFPALAPHPNHSLALAPALAATCRDANLIPMPGRWISGQWVQLEGAAGDALLAGADWTDPANWPAQGEHRLGGGTDGLQAVGSLNWMRSLAETAGLPDAALVCCPDLVLGAATEAAPIPVALPATDCTDLADLPRAVVNGQVFGLQLDGTRTPLGGVDIRVAGYPRQARSAADGQFTLASVPLAILTLRLRLPGYEPLDVPVQSTEFTTAADVQLDLAQLSAARVLPGEEVLQVQRAMLDAQVVGPWKLALLDSPDPMARIDDLRVWRNLLGDSDRGMFSVPWLLPGESGASPACPPCGHLAGEFAAAELAGGVHQGAANRPLRHAQGVTVVVDDPEQELLNPSGINPVRAFDGRGLRLHGIRTLSTDPAWQFATVRRLLDAIEKTLLRLAEPLVFEPNNELLWHCATTTVEAFLGGLYRAGMLAGSSEEAAFTVRCDEQVNPQDSRDAGRLVIEVAVAPVVPYEFLTFRIGHAFDALSLTEVG